MFNSLNSNATQALSSSAPQVPERFFCRFTLEMMIDPVIAADGHSYERSSIEQYLKIPNAKSLINNQPFAHKNLTPNDTLRAEINAWKLQNQSVVTKITVDDLRPKPSTNISNALEFDDNLFAQTAWWQEQANLWEKAKPQALQHMPAIQTQEVRDTLTAQLNSNFRQDLQHHTVRLLLIQGATANAPLRDIAIKTRNEDVLKLVCFYQRSFFTANEFLLAIQYKNSIEFLKWMLQVTQIPEKKFSDIQAAVACVGDTALMLSTIVKTTNHFRIFSAALHAAIQAENGAILSLFCSDHIFVSDIEAQNSTQLWTECVTNALACKNPEILSIILAHKSDEISFNQAVYDKMSALSHLAALEALARKIAPPEIIYYTLLQNFLQHTSAVEQKIHQEWVKKEKAQDILYSFCEYHSNFEDNVLGTILFLGCCGILVGGILRFTNITNTEFKHHEGDNDYNNHRQKTLNNHTGLAMIIIGAVFAVLTAIAPIKLTVRSSRYFYEYSQIRYNVFCLEKEKENLFINFSKLVHALKKQNVPLQLNYLATISNETKANPLHEKIMALYSEVYTAQNSTANTPTFIENCYSCFYKKKAPIILMDNGRTPLISDAV